MVKAPKVSRRDSPPYEANKGKSASRVISSNPIPVSLTVARMVPVAEDRIKESTA